MDWRGPTPRPAPVEVTLASTLAMLGSEWPPSCSNPGNAVSQTSCQWRQPGSISLRLATLERLDLVGMLVLRGWTVQAAMVQAPHSKGEPNLDLGSHERGRDGTTAQTHW